MASASPRRAISIASPKVPSRSWRIVILRGGQKISAVFNG